MKSGVTRIVICFVLVSLPFQYLDCLWSQIKNLQSHKWMENQINRPYLSFDAVLSEALQHTLPQIIPPAHDEDAVYPLPSVVFRMFDYTDVPEVSSNLARCLCVQNKGSETGWSQKLEADRQR